jgi:hypothetical protein
MSELDGVIQNQIRRCLWEQKGQLGLFGKLRRSHSIVCKGKTKKAQPYTVKPLFNESLGD